MVSRSPKRPPRSLGDDDNDGRPLLPWSWRPLAPSSSFDEASASYGSTSTASSERSVHARAAAAAAAAPLLPPSADNHPIEAARGCASWLLARCGLRRLTKGRLVAGLLVLIAVIVGVDLAWGSLTTKERRREEGDASWASDAVFDHLGPYAPFRPARDGPPSYSVPKGWAVDQVVILHRHGSRYPSTNLIPSALAKVRTSRALRPVEEGGEPLLGEWEFLRAGAGGVEGERRWWRMGSFDMGGLTDFGRKEAWASGLLARKRYGSLLARHSGRTTASSLLRGLIAWNNDQHSVWARASGMARTIDSARHFLDGLAGRPFDLVLGSDDELSQAEMTKGRQNEKVEVLPFGREWNCSLSVGSCAAERLLDPNPGRVAEHAWLATYSPSVASRLNALLRMPEGQLLDEWDVVALMSMCGFDSVASGELGSRSAWCDVFTSSEWAANAYFHDLSKYFFHSHGAPFGRTKGASWVNELIARLTDSDAVVQAGATNISSVGPPGGERFFLDMSHDNTMVSVLAVLGLALDAVPLPTAPAGVPAHVFEVDQLTPFAGRFVFERLVQRESGGRHTNGRESKSMRMLINDKPVLWPPISRISRGEPREVISVDDFVDRMSFAQGGGDWERCVTLTNAVEP